MPFKPEFLIAQGGFSNVYFARDENGAVAALKFIRKRDKKIRVEDEAKAISLLQDHTSVPSLIEHYVDGEGQDVIAMEYVKGQELFEYVRSLTDGIRSEKPYLLQSIMKQIAASVQHCHSLGVVHGDIKLENFLLTADFCVKLIDFGLAVILDRKEDRTFDPKISGCFGSIEYLSPERRDKTYDGFMADVYSMGVVNFALLTGKFPFGDDDTLRRAQEFDLTMKDIRSKRVGGGGGGGEQFVAGDDYGEADTYDQACSLMHLLHESVGRCPLFRKMRRVTEDLLRVAPCDRISAGDVVAILGRDTERGCCSCSPSSLSLCTAGGVVVQKRARLS